MKKLITLLLLFFGLNAFSQNDWRSQGVIYKDAFITVELQYRISKDVCTNNRSSKYRFILLGTGSNRDHYLNWRFSYYNCKSELICQSNYLNIGERQNFGTIENMDWTFPGEKLGKPFFDVRDSIAPDLTPPYTCSPPKIVKPPSGTSVPSPGTRGPKDKKDQMRKPRTAGSRPASLP